MTYELMVMKSALNSFSGDSLKDYIQSIGVDPFLVVFYLEQQLPYCRRQQMQDRCPRGARGLHGQRHEKRSVT